MTIGKRYDTGTLTREQIADCYIAGRSPVTGRRYRTGEPSVAEKSARVMNWKKLQITGSIGQLRHVARNTVDSESVGNLMMTYLDIVEKRLLAAILAEHETNKRR